MMKYSHGEAGQQIVHGKVKSETRPRVGEFWNSQLKNPRNCPSSQLNGGRADSPSHRLQSSLPIDSLQREQGRELNHKQPKLENMKKEEQRQSYIRLDAYESSAIRFKNYASRIPNLSQSKKSDEIYGARVEKQEMNSQYKGKIQPLPKEESHERSQHLQSRVDRSRRSQNDVRDKVGNKQEQQQFPCPFCSVPLLPSQIFHLNQCDDGKQCKYCKERYPLDLISTHNTVCPKKKQQLKKPQIKQEKKESEASDIRKCTRCQEEYVLGFYGDHLRFCKGLNPQMQTVKCIKCEVMIPSWRVQAHTRHCLGSGSFHKRINPAPRQIPKPQPQKKSKRREEPAYNPRFLDEQSRLRASQHKGLTESKIAGLQRGYFIREDTQNTECAICMLQFELGQEYINLNCNHCFHSDCLSPWLETNANCPNCKQRVQSKRS